MKQQIRYCTTSDNARIAYAVTGSGTPIIRTSHWLTHLEHDFTNPVWKHVMLGLARNHQLVRYDSRGEGMSPRDCPELSFDAWLKDLEAVVDAVGLPRFALFGCSQGASVAIAYAAKYPERVTHLILYGGFARGKLNRGNDPVAARQKVDLEKALVLQGWGTKNAAHRQWFSSVFLPDGSTDLYRWYNELQQVSTSPEIAARHLETSAALDVTGLLPQVKTPTLILHCRGDVVAPFELGEELAASIPGARLVPLEGDNHLFLAGSRAHREFLHAVCEFLGDPPPKGHLPGTRSFAERLQDRVVSTEQNWLIKVLLLIGAVIGLVLSIIQILQSLG